MIRNCRLCSVELNDDNWSHSRQKKGDYICNRCKKETRDLYYETNRDELNAQARTKYKNNPEKAKAKSEKAHRKEGHLPMSKNKDCPVYLGVYRAERLLKFIFDDVEVMPYGNKGYDLVCNRGMKVDSKSSCIRKTRNGWTFGINHNTIADYFACIAFDNRADLNPLHFWLIPGHVLNHLTTATISQSKINKWEEYERPIGELISCCNTIREL